MGHEWYRQVDGRKAGPFTIDQLRAWVAKGSMPPDELVGREGTITWVPVSSVLSDVEEAGPITREPPFRLGGDPGPFRLIARQFHVNGHWYGGRVVASDQALYLLKASWTNRGALIPSLFGGLLGRLIFSWVMGPSGPPDRLWSCRLSELSGALREVLDPTAKYAARDVIVLSRQSVPLVESSPWTGRLEAYVGRERFTVPVGRLRLGDVRRVMEAGGWSFELPRATTANPSFRIGTDEHDAGEHGSPVRRRLLGAMVGVVIAGLAVVRIYGMAKQMVRAEDAAAQVPPPLPPGAIQIKAVRPVTPLAARPIPAKSAARKIRK
jgi:hypothetical protein